MSLDFDKIVATPGGRREFGALVRNRRVALDMLQAELAEEAKCMLYQVQNAEVGACYASGVLRRIAEVLSIDASKVWE